MTDRLRQPKLFSFPAPARTLAPDAPWDIADALHMHFAAFPPGTAWEAHVEVVDADTAAPRMVCCVGTTSKSWRIDSEDVTAAPQVIADVIAEIREGQERPN